jgi:hypothetical protein
VIPTKPDDGSLDAVTPAVPVDGGWAHEAWAWITGLPTWIAPAVLAGILAAALIAFPLLRAQARKAGERTAGAVSDDDRKDRQLLIAALIPAVLFWLAVLTGSARGLIAFAKDNLHWTGGWEFLVPFTLDGVAVSFGVLAFRAVRKERNPDRATRIAWGAMIASAVIQYGHESSIATGSALGGLYLALLSLLGMLIFHEFLGQFEDGAAWIKRANPKFGLRWFTWPSNTVCAWFAWRNYPPAEGTKATVGNAVIHLAEVRAGKAKLYAEDVDHPAWWTALAPWVRISGLTEALSEQRSEASAERALREKLDEDIQRLMVERDTALRQQSERHRTELERERSIAAEQLATERAEHAAHVSRIREKSTVAPSGAPTRNSTKTAPATSTAESRLTNDEAVALMLREHPEPGYEWGTREVSRLTGAGFGRVPKLIAAVREHHDRSAGTGDRNTPEDDAKERAS